MTALSKAREKSMAVLNTAHANAVRMKAAGMLDRMVTPSLMSGPVDWQQQSKSRENYAMFRSWVYAAINALASEAAGQPVNVGRFTNGAGSKQRAPRGLKDCNARTMTKNIRRKAEGGSVEMVQDHPLIDILDHPNPLQHKYQFVYSFVANLNLTGRAYIVKDEEDGRTVYYSLPSTWVRPDHSQGPYKRFYVANPRDLDFASKQEPLDASQVAFAFLPNPADPMGAISPASSQSAAIRIDDRIQVCEEKFFDNGVFPSVIVSVGKDPHPDVPGGIRPRLSGTQRRQVTGAIRRAMASVANYGNPAIVDGLIESIIPFSRGQSEIGWDKSEGTLKTRILSAFGVHPFILGEPVGVGGYAQTYVIEERFCKRGNVFLDLLSLLMSHFVGNFSASSEDVQEKLLIWWDAMMPSDPSLDWSNWKYARTNGDVTQNEFRTRLGLAPTDNKASDRQVIGSGAMMSAVGTLVSQVGMGALSPEQCSTILEASGIPKESADRMSGVGVQIPISQPALLGGPSADPLGQATGALQAAIAELRTPMVASVKDVLRSLE
jgi:phage portal protein BeeE